MVLRFSILAVAFLLSCTSIERDSVCDEKSVKYNGCVGAMPSDGGRFMDSRDDKYYRYVKIGEQTWMAENLNYTTSGSKCYDNKESNCATYGRLYDWATAMDLTADCNTGSCKSQISEKHRGICPTGWHIPSNDDWNTLMKIVNPSCSDNSDCAGAGTELKATSGWDSYIDTPSGSDRYGFSALPGGYDSGSIGYYGYWWSASEDGLNVAYYRYMSYSDERVYWGNDVKSRLFSVRCLQD
jgi:uncharacterized protein (TIGR02145 family)